MLRFLASIKSYSYGLNVPKYLMDQNLCTLQTEISKIQKLSHSILVFCKQTIFHPQGGGQPDDKGLLKIQDIKCEVSILKSHKISRQNGSCNIAYEIPYNEQTSKLQQKMKFTMLIDTQFRLKMKKMHTAGHILDLAMKQLIKQLSYGACGHYPDNSFVQYYINKNEIKKDLFQLKAELQKKIIEITNRQINIQRQILSQDEGIQRSIIQNKSILKGADYVRIIKIGESWCCCGGTHLNNTLQLKDSLKIKKIINKEKTPEKISIKYEVF